jgi:hypothetical protein
MQFQINSGCKWNLQGAEDCQMSDKNYLVIAIVSPLGTPKRKIFTDAVKSFCDEHYESLQLNYESVKITKENYFQNYAEGLGCPAKDVQDKIQQIDLYIKAGDKARKDSNDYGACVKKALGSNFYRDNKITVIDQIKHKAEWDYLVEEHGKENTLLIGLFSSEKNRRHHLKAIVSDKSSDNMALLEKLLIKDQYGYKEIVDEEKASYSQQVGEFFMKHMPSLIWMPLMKLFKGRLKEY